VKVSETIDDARHLIETRLAEIRAEAGQLERALAGLGKETARRPGRRGPRSRRTGTAPAKVVSATSGRRATPRRRSAPRRKAAKRAARGERREQVLAAIAASPGARPSELAAAIGIRPTQVSVLIAKLRGEGLIVKSGKGYAQKP
jgi:DNA-binding transcriptional ArsR family regulator